MEYISGRLVWYGMVCTVLPGTAPGQLVRLDAGYGRRPIPKGATTNP